MKLIIEELHAAAFHLTKYPESTAEQVAAYVGKSKRTIERWSETAEWHTALDNLGFEGDRNWRRAIQRDIQRESGDLVQRAKETYQQLRKDGTPRHKLIRETADTLNIPIPRLRNWVKRFNWGTSPKKEAEGNSPNGDLKTGF